MTFRRVHAGKLPKFSFKGTSVGTLQVKGKFSKMTRLATADYSFPLLGWEKVLRLSADLGMEGIDISLFQDRSHLKPEEALANPSVTGAKVKAAVNAAGLAVADVFGIPGRDFVELCPNHTEPAVRRASREYFQRLVDFAVACGGVHLSSLPGIIFESETFESSFARSTEEMCWRVEVAHRAGLIFAVEPHIGSIISDPKQAELLVGSVPGLTLTLDLSHFVAQGYPQADANPLIDYSSHVHARCGSPGRLQASLKANTIDFSDLVKRLTARNYSGWYAIEYVWIDWEHCNEVDNLSETILMRGVLEAAARVAA
jgi:sugar phosphate isomerase/epimerase